MTEEIVDDLVRETSRDLDEVSVGLFELVWSLRPLHPTLPDSELDKFAQQAHRRLLQDPTVRQVWLVWPNMESTGDATGIEPRARDWETPAGEPYLGFERTQEAIDALRSRR